ncbi:hypothetical protein BHM03_00043274 [Ensete ventricosum]|nr:hypothetical protein BHM03_00043274 [Ensete ventricosum]
MSSVVLAARCASAGNGCQPCPPYLCQVGRMTADTPMTASGRLPRVGSTTLAGQLSGGTGTWRPVVRGHEDVAASWNVLERDMVGRSSDQLLGIWLRVAPSWTLDLCTQIGVEWGHSRLNPFDA